MSDTTEYAADLVNLVISDALERTGGGWLPWLNADTQAIKALRLYLTLGNPLPDDLKSLAEVLGSAPTLFPSIDLIEAERIRQVGKGYVAEEDTDLYGGTTDLSDAGACYALADAGDRCRIAREAIWPWDKDRWSPREDRLTNLVRAAALIAAAIDRIVRLSKAVS